MKILLYLTCLLSINFCFSQSSDSIVPKRIYNTIVLPENQQIKLDAYLDEEIWESADWGTGFRVRQPNNGDKAIRETKFKIVYDQDFIYVGYVCLDDEPDKIEKRLSRRDNFPGDWIEINFDSYMDNSTGFSFTVSASGVKGDEFITGNGNNWDESWNPIWYASTRITEEGWNAEIKIPLSQLRFSQAIEQEWGFNIQRRDFRADEFNSFQFIPQNSSGYISNFAILKGLKNLKPKRQIETQPYIVAGRSTGKNSKYKLTGGLDGKIGLSSNITLDYTLNPDFGQVDADPSVLNIDGFEVFFQERRPFFIENSNLFSFDGTNAEAGGSFNNDNLFYSRRIGSNPRGYQAIPNQAQGVKRPDFTNILGAAKVSGKTKDGWSLGILEGVTAEEHILYSIGETEHKAIVEPLSNYFVGRLSKDIQGGVSQIGATMTQVTRFLDDTGLEDQYHKTTSSGGINLFHSWKERKWQIVGKFLASNVTGSTLKIKETQEDFRHYFQRPDAAHLNVDDSKTNLAGHGGDLALANYGGEDNISYQFGLTWRSPGLELNDIGFLNSADIINHYFWAGYRFPKPFSIFRSARINYNHYLGWTFDGVNNFQAVNTNIHGGFTNFWESGTGVTIIFKEISNKALFGGPSLRTSSGFNNWGYLGSDSRKKLRANIFWSKFTPFLWDKGSSNRYSFELSLNYQASDALSISAGPGYSYNFNALQNVTFDNFQNQDRYVTGSVEQRTLSMSLRLSYNFTPNLTLEYWGQPFISKGEYTEFKYISDPLASKFEDRYTAFENSQIQFSESDEYLVDENQDGLTDYQFENPNFNFLQFRSNAVMRWEYIPGSELFLVWSQGVTNNGDPEKKLIPSLRNDLFTEKITNNFLIKLTYRLIN